MSGTRPKHGTTWNDYMERILRVLTHIQDHLDEPLELERLERAAIELKSGAMPVMQVALDAGYEAHEAFTRAFKAAYRVPPAEFRRATGPVAIRPAPSGVHFRPGVPLTTFNT